MDSTTDRPRRWISGVEPAPELLSATGTQILDLECRQQPATLQELIREYSTDPAIRSTMGKLREAAALKKGPVLFIGMELRFVLRLAAPLSCRPMDGPLLR